MQYIIYKIESLSRKKKSYPNSIQQDFDSILNMMIYWYYFWTIFKLSKRFSFWIRSLNTTKSGSNEYKIQKHTKQRNSKIYFFFVSSSSVLAQNKNIVVHFHFSITFLLRQKKNHNNSCCIFVSSIRSHVEQISIYFQLLLFLCVWLQSNSTSGILKIQQ